MLRVFASDQSAWRQVRAEATEGAAPRVPSPADLDRLTGGGFGGSVADLSTPGKPTDDRIIALLKREARPHAACHLHYTSQSFGCSDVVIPRSALFDWAPPAQTGFHRWALRLECEWTKVAALHDKTKKLADAAKEARSRLCCLTPEMPRSSAKVVFPDAYQAARRSTVRPQRLCGVVRPSFEMSSFPSVPVLRPCHRGMPSRRERWTKLRPSRRPSRRTSRSFMRRLHSLRSAQRRGARSPKAPARDRS
jgi:hypothetical protein